MKSKKLLISLAVLLVTTSLLITGCKNNDVTKENEEKELLISAAASLTDVMGELKESYIKLNPNTKLTFSFAGSGSLQAQIEEGAPVDVFISAAEKQMNALEEKDLILKDTRKTLLVNKVVLITPSDNKLNLSNFEDITNEDIDKIAIGDPTNVPVGQYSEEIFNNLDMMDTIKPKLIFGNDVRTVLTWVEADEVDCGLVYATDAYTTDKVSIIDKAPEGSHKAVTYPVAVVGDSKEVEESKKFIEFLSSDEAKDIFENYGFSMK